MNKQDIILNGSINKGAKVAGLDITDDEMAKINKHTLSPLGSDDVFTFKVLMCDNAIDRHHEHFSMKALHQMKDLYIGKPIIKDHDPSADNQVGRVYDTELMVTDEIVKETGQNYAGVVAKCYVLNNDKNKDLISDIVGGIKKEVSVSTRVNELNCSICGMNNVKTACPHWWGKEYDGETCHFELGDVTDVLELSFVATPAQRKAGTMKANGANTMSDEIVDSKKESINDLNEAILKAQLDNVNTFLKIRKGDL